MNFDTTSKVVLHTLYNMIQMQSFRYCLHDPSIQLYLYAVLNSEARQNWLYPRKLHFLEDDTLSLKKTTIGK